ncbi:hypothetical protein SE17_24795 [Kouleothrix aurantiaca]|uniref:UmuC domain-containing protein n=1 Tax=Kouleothrix aurantiaca TaxID=186479 RepID=A0A0P9DDI4_9CHLR|nr:hypothetical protein SE17_24795 [Kouleothrix aurantiaca]
MKSIACIHIPTPAIAIVRRDNPLLAKQPIVLYTPDPQRPLVYSASRETGIAEGMALRQAQVRCPHAVYRVATPAHDQYVFTELARLAERYSPRVVVDHFHPDIWIDLDLGPIDLPAIVAQTQRLAQHIRTELGLNPALGVAATRFVAQRAASTARPGSVAVISAGQAAAFLAPQPVTALPIDNAHIERLERLGLRTIGTVARIPIDALQVQFGVAGAQIARLVHGADEHGIPANSVLPHLCRKHCFDGPLANRQVLELAIGALGAELVRQLQAGAWASGAIHMRFVLDYGEPWVRATGAQRADK